MRSSQPSGVPIDSKREQLGVLGQPALDEDRRALRIEAGGEPVDHHVVDVLLDDLAVLVVRRQRMPVGDEVEAVVVGLQADPVLQRAVVVAEMQLAGRPHAGEDALARGGRGRGVGSFMRCGAAAVSRERNCRWRPCGRRYTAPGMKNIVILISGRGSNMEAIAKACADERWNARIAAVVSNRPESGRSCIRDGARHPGRELRSPRVRVARGVRCRVWHADRGVPARRRRAGRLHADPLAGRSSSASKAASSTSIRRCCPRSPACTRTGARSRPAARSGRDDPLRHPVLDHGRSSRRRSCRCTADDTEDTLAAACSRASMSSIRARSAGWSTTRSQVADGIVTHRRGESQLLI
jgi:phosphoribosylglycinamide formyltransferase-1